jgi:hypothetical protein
MNQHEVHVLKVECSVAEAITLLLAIAIAKQRATSIDHRDDLELLRQRICARMRGTQRVLFSAGRIEASSGRQISGGRSTAAA